MDNPAWRSLILSALVFYLGCDGQEVRNVTMCWMGGPYTDAQLSCQDQPGTEIYILGGIYYLSTCDVSAGCCLGPTDCCEYPSMEGSLWDAQDFCHGQDWCELTISEPMELWTTCYNNAMDPNYVHEVFYSCVSPGATPTTTDFPVPGRCIWTTAAPSTTTTAAASTTSTVGASTTTTTTTTASSTSTTTSPSPHIPDNSALKTSHSMITGLIAIIVAVVSTNM